jgi:hypothetical protein
MKPQKNRIRFNTSETETGSENRHACFSFRLRFRIACISTMVPYPNSCRQFHRSSDGLEHIDLHISHRRRNLPQGSSTWSAAWLLAPCVWGVNGPGPCTMDNSQYYRQASGTILQWYDATEVWCVSSTVILDASMAPRRSWVTKYLAAKFSVACSPARWQTTQYPNQVASMIICSDILQNILRSRNQHSQSFRQ